MEAQLLDVLARCGVGGEFAAAIILEGEIIVGEATRAKGQWEEIGVRGGMGRALAVNVALRTGVPESFIVIAVNLAGARRKISRVRRMAGELGDLRHDRQAPVVKRVDDGVGGLRHIAVGVADPSPKPDTSQ